MSSKAAARKATGPDKRDQEPLAIRFVNTAAWRLRAAPEERLPDVATLLEWLTENELVSAEDRARLASRWLKDAQRGAAALRTALRLREALYQIFTALMRGRAPPAAALKQFNELFSKSIAQAALEARAGGLRWGGPPSAASEELFRAIVVSAAELMTGPGSGRVKQCQDHRGCGWLFVDNSRAFNRRWCSMGDCGNIAKAQRHYERMRRRRFEMEYLEE